MSYTFSYRSQQSSHTSSIKRGKQLHYKNLQRIRYYWVAPLLCVVVVIGIGSALAIGIPLVFPTPIQSRNTIVFAFNNVIRDGQNESVLEKERQQIRVFFDSWTTPIDIKLIPYGSERSLTSYQYTLPIESGPLMRKVEELLSGAEILNTTENPSQRSAVKQLLSLYRSSRRSNSLRTSDNREKLVLLPPPREIYRSVNDFDEDCIATGEELRRVENTRSVHLLVERADDGQLYNITLGHIFTDPALLSQELQDEIMEKSTKTTTTSSTVSLASTDGPITSKQWTASTDAIITSASGPTTTSASTSATKLTKTTEVLSTSSTETTTTPSSRKIEVTGSSSTTN